MREAEKHSDESEEGRCMKWNSTVVRVRRRVREAELCRSCEEERGLPAVRRIFHGCCILVSTAQQGPKLASKVIGSLSHGGIVLRFVTCQVYVRFVSCETRYAKFLTSFL